MVKQETRDVFNMQTIASIWRENMLGYFSADIICSEKRTVSFEEQMMSKDKFLSMFSAQMEAIVFIILQIFLATRKVLKTGALRVLVSPN